MSTARSDEAREREALAREIAETRKVRIDTARQAAALLRPTLKRFAARWDAMVEERRPQEPPAA